MKVKKAIRPATGLGTRFLPATKAQLKEMNLPAAELRGIYYSLKQTNLLIV